LFRHRFPHSLPTRRSSDLTELTIEEFLTYTAHLRLMPSDRVAKAVQDVMEKCSVAHFRNRLIRNLSGGYRQRVGIAQAIIHEPEDRKSTRLNSSHVKISYA